MPSPGNPDPYPSTSVSELNDTAWFNQYRPRVLSSFMKVVLIEQNEAFSRFSFLKVWSNHVSHRPLIPLLIPILHSSMTLLKPFTAILPFAFSKKINDNFYSGLKQPALILKA